MTDPSTLDKLLASLSEATMNLSAYLDDQRDIAVLVDAHTRVAGAAADVKAVADSVGGQIRNAVTAKPVFLPDGRTIRLDPGKRRVMLPTGRALVLSRIIERAVTRRQGEIDAAALCDVAAEVVEVFCSPSAEPKAGPLKQLGLTWKDIASEEEAPGKVVIE